MKLRNMADALGAVLAFVLFVWVILQIDSLGAKIANHWHEPRPLVIWPR